MAFQTLEDLGEHILMALDPDVSNPVVRHQELMIDARLGAIGRVLTFLRDDANCQFGQLANLSGVDYPERDQRFDVVYNMLSHKQSPIFTRVNSYLKI